MVCPRSYQSAQTYLTFVKAQPQNVSQDFLKELADPEAAEIECVLLTLTAWASLTTLFSQHCCRTWPKSGRHQISRIRDLDRRKQALAARLSTEETPKGADLSIRLQCKRGLPYLYIGRQATSQQPAQSFEVKTTGKELPTAHQLIGSKS